MLFVEKKKKNMNQNIKINCIRSHHTDFFKYTKINKKKIIIIKHVLIILKAPCVCKMYISKDRYYNTASFIRLVKEYRWRPSAGVWLSKLG